MKVTDVHLAGIIKSGNLNLTIYIKKLYYYF